MSNPIAVIGVPSSAGAFAPGQEQAPAALRRAGLLEKLAEAGIAVSDQGDSPVWRWKPDRDNPHAQNLDAVVSQAQMAAARVRSALTAGQIPLVLGGDCTVELGTVAGFLPTERRVGLLYFDMHADLNVPESVPEGALDWMGMAHLLGEDQAVAELSRFGPRFPLLDVADVCVFAQRPERATSWEQDAISRHGLRTVHDVAVAADPEETATVALAHLAHVEQMLIHFDVDVIDFTDAPLSENTGRNEGLTLEQAFRALRVLVASPAFAALTITELNPDHGEQDGTTLERFVTGLVDALGNSPVVARARL
jgi:arginase